MSSYKAAGAADGFTILGALVLFLFAWTQMIIPGYYLAIAGNLNGTVTLILGIVLFVITIISVVASGLVRWVIPRSGLLLLIFGFIALVITLQGLNFDLLTWLSHVGAVGSVMLMIAGVLRWLL